jgi:hypothetical protein
VRAHSSRGYTRRGALDRTAFETKPYLEGYLELRLALGVHRSPDVLDLEPFEVAQRLVGLFQRVAHGLMDALFGYPDQRLLSCRFYRAWDFLLTFAFMTCGHRAAAELLS